MNLVDSNNKDLIMINHILDNMKKTLALVVDRDNDFGVKGGVHTPVIGVQNCLNAATAFGIADPEDSDLNALYAAISVCLEMQEDGYNADVALICGDEKVGHRADLNLVSQLEKVLNITTPDTVVLIGDGAEDEYVYPIISSRANVDSVVKVFVKQAPGLEGSLYILAKMVADPGKRKRFLAPLGFVLVMVSLFFVVPDILVYSMDHDMETITSMSGSLVIFFFGTALLLYSYSIINKLSSAKKYMSKHIIAQSTKFIFLCISISMIFMSGIWIFYEINDLYISSLIPIVIYAISSTIWPLIIAVIFYMMGSMIDSYVNSGLIKLSSILGCINLASVGLVTLGILDMVLSYISRSTDTYLAIPEIVSGVFLSIFVSFYKSHIRINSINDSTTDEVL